MSTTDAFAGYKGVPAAVVFVVGTGDRAGSPGLVADDVRGRRNETELLDGGKGGEETQKRPGEEMEGPSLLQMGASTGYSL